MEKLDLYTKDKIKTDTIIVRGEKVPEGLYRLVAHVCIFDNKGRMLIQKRSLNKKSWAGLWDVSCGGCVSSGETSVEGIRREVKEELGVNLDSLLIRESACFNFSEGFDDFYIIDATLDISTLHLQKEEVEEVRYATLEEIKELSRKGEFITYHDHFFDILFEMHHTKEIYKEYK